MADTARTLTDLQTILADNTSAAISPQDIRDMLVSTFPYAAKGDLPGLDATLVTGRLPVGADGTVLVADSAQTFGFKWGSTSGSVGADTIWDAKGDLAVGSGSDTSDNLPVGANDTFLIADSTVPTFGLKWGTSIAAATIAALTADTIVLQSANKTYTAAPNLISINTTITLAVVAGSAIAGIALSPTVKYATAGAALNMYYGFLNNPTIQNDANVNPVGIHGFVDDATVHVITNTLTLADWSSFRAHPTFTNATGGVMGVTQLSLFRGQIRDVPSGSTITTMRGFWYENALHASGGAITTQIGVDIAALSSGSSNIGIRTASDIHVNAGAAVRLYSDTSTTAMGSWNSTTGNLAIGGTQAYTGNVAMITSAGTVTWSSGTPSYRFIYTTATIKYLTAPSVFGYASFFTHANTYINDASATVDPGPINVFIDQGVNTFDTASGRTLSFWVSFNSSPTFSVVGTGAGTITNADQFFAGPSSAVAIIPSGIIVTTRRGFHALNWATSGTGSIGTQVGVDIDALTGATTNIGIRTAAPIYVVSGTTIKLYSDAGTTQHGSWNSANGALVLGGANTYTAVPTFLAISSAMTVDVAGASWIGSSFSSTVSYAQNGGLSIGYSHSAVHKNQVAVSITPPSVIGFNEAGTLQIDAQTKTVVGYGSYRSAPTMDRINGSGALTVTTQYALSSDLTVNGSTTVTTSSRVVINDATGAGAVGTQVGIDIASLAKATTNFGIRNASNSVQTGYARFGAVTAPTNVTAGDVTAVRGLFGADGALPNNNTLAVQPSDFTLSADGAVMTITAAKNSGAGVAFTAVGLDVVFSDKSGSGTQLATRGVRSAFTHSGAGTLTAGQGFTSTLTHTAGTTTRYDYFLAAFIAAGATGTLTTASGLRVENIGNAIAGTAIGVDIEAQSGATTNVGFRNASTLLNTKWAFFGATAATTTAPNNVTDGDVTMTRLSVGDVAFTSGVEAQINGDSLVTGYMRIGSATNPTNVGAGDLTTVNYFSTGYMRVGSQTAPTQTGAGALTVAKLFAGDSAAVTGAVIHATGDIIGAGYISAKATITTSLNTTAGDVSGLRGMFGTDLAIPAGGAVLFLNQGTAAKDVLRMRTTPFGITNAVQVTHIIDDVPTTTNGATTLHIFTLAANTNYMIYAIVTARRTGGSSGAADDGAVYIRAGSFKGKDGVTAAQEGSTSALMSQETDQTGWDCTLSVTSNTVQCQVTGATSNNISWGMYAIVMAVSS